MLLLVVFHNIYAPMSDLYTNTEQRKFHFYNIGQWYMPVTCNVVLKYVYSAHSHMVNAIDSICGAHMYIHPQMCPREIWYISEKWWANCFWHINGINMKLGIQTFTICTMTSFWLFQLHSLVSIVSRRCVNSVWVLGRFPIFQHWSRCLGVWIVTAQCSNIVQKVCGTVSRCMEGDWLCLGVWIVSGCPLHRCPDCLGIWTVFKGVWCSVQKVIRQCLYSTWKVPGSCLSVEVFGQYPCFWIGSRESRSCLDCVQKLFGCLCSHPTVFRCLTLSGRHDSIPVISMRRLRQCPPGMQTVSGYLDSIQNVLICKSIISQLFAWFGLLAKRSLWNQSWLMPPTYMCHIYVLTSLINAHHLHGKCVQFGTSICFWL